jgi:hypothetical protein
VVGILAVKPATESIQFNIVIPAYLTPEFFGFFDSSLIGTKYTLSFETELKKIK